MGLFSYRCSGSPPVLSWHLQRRPRGWGSGRACSVCRALLRASAWTKKERDEEEGKQRAFFVWRQSCMGPAVRLKNSSIIWPGQLDSYLLPAGCSWIDASVWMYRLWYIPTCWERHSYWWSRPASSGCFQGLPVDCCPCCRRTAAAVVGRGRGGGKDKNLNSAHRPFTLLSSHIYTPVLYPPLYCYSVSPACGRWPKATGIKGWDRLKSMAESGIVG